MLKLDPIKDRIPSKTREIDTENTISGGQKTKVEGHSTSPESPILSHSRKIVLAKIVLDLRHGIAFQSTNCSEKVQTKQRAVDSLVDDGLFSYVAPRYGSWGQVGRPRHQLGQCLVPYMQPWSHHQAYRCHVCCPPWLPEFCPELSCFCRLVSLFLLYP